LTFVDALQHQFRVWEMKRKGVNVEKRTESCGSAEEGILLAAASIDSEVDNQAGCGFAVPPEVCFASSIDDAFSCGLD
jgi:hypothetical protein